MTSISKLQETIATIKIRIKEYELLLKRYEEELEKTIEEDRKFCLSVPIDDIIEEEGIIIPDDEEEVVVEVKPSPVKPSKIGETEIETFINEVYSKLANVPAFKGNKLTYKLRQKYAVITRWDSSGSPYQTQTWCYISLIDNPITGNKAGDLLLPNCGKPAKGARGNILDGTARYNWTGPVYLK